MARVELYLASNCRNLQAAILVTEAVSSGL